MNSAPSAASDSTTTTAATTTTATSIPFADRHAATVSFMKALKALKSLEALKKEAVSSSTGTSASSNSNSSTRQSTVASASNAAEITTNTATVTATATELEAECLASAGQSRAAYLAAVQQRRDALLLLLEDAQRQQAALSTSTSTTDSALTTAGELRAESESTKQASHALQTTTGVADSHVDGGEKQTIGKYTAVYHERSLNAVVYKSWDPMTGAIIALKIVALSRQVAPHDIQREAKLLRLVTDPNIVRLLDAEMTAGGLFALKLPYMRFDLSSLAAQNVLSPSQKQRHLHALFAGIAAVHEAGVIHRDIKPSNVLLDSPEGPAQLIDFGISWKKELNTSEPEDDKITDVGTGAYRPPELLFGCRDYGVALDMWAAGCTVAEVLEGGGKSLFDAGTITKEDFLGSDLALINSIFRKLGTPTDDTWPEARNFNDWGKIQFKRFPALSWQELMPNVGPTGRDLVSKLVVFSSTSRMPAAECLEHAFFKSEV